MPSITSSVPCGASSYCTRTDRPLSVKDIPRDRLPLHVAIIMDGNGRWAKKRFLPRAAGHRAGVEAVRATIDTCARLGIQALTIYAFSVENWKRPQEEIDTLWALLDLYVTRELDNLIRNNVRIRAIGRLHLLPERVQAKLSHAVQSTASNTGLHLNVAVNYGGRTELVDAVNAAVEEAKRTGNLDNWRLDERQIDEHLYTAGLPDPDLLIRTSGEMRISNFLLWQIAYSELYVTNTLWPDFCRTDLLKAVLDYQKRDRRFGGLNRKKVPLSDRRIAEVVGISTE